MRLFVVLFFCAIISVSKGNPSFPPPVLLTELYFDLNGKWQMEIALWGNVSYMDSVRIVSGSEFFQFLPADMPNQQGIIILSSYDIAKSFSIDQNKDSLVLFYRYAELGWNEIMHLNIGMQPTTYNNGYSIPPINNGQSVRFHSKASGLGGYFFYYKCNYPDLGVTNWDFECKGYLEGTICDAAHNPVAYHAVNIISYWPKSFIYTTLTDSVGHYFLTLHPSYHIISFEQSNPAQMQFSTMIVLEPDDTVHFDVVMDSTFFGIPELVENPWVTISNYPNPFTESTSFRINYKGSLHAGKGVVKIFDLQGEIVSILPISINSLGSGKYTLPFSAKSVPLHTGSYYYTLELNGQKMATGKMLYVR